MLDGNLCTLSGISSSSHWQPPSHPWLTHYISRVSDDCQSVNIDGMELVIFIELAFQDLSYFLVVLDVAAILISPYGYYDTMGCQCSWSVYLLCGRLVVPPYVHILSTQDSK